MNTIFSKPNLTSKTWKEEEVQSREHVEAIRALRQTSQVNSTIARLMTDIQQAVSHKVTPTTPALIAPEGFESADRKFVYGKLYRFKSYSFEVWNPARLTEKQRKVVNDFVKEMNRDGAHVNLTFQLAAPWIDVIFQFNRGEMTEATFNSITGLFIKTSVLNRHNDHSL